jgi:hypothetical protein
MISTVTTTVVALVMSSYGWGLLAAVGTAAVATLIASLVMKELASNAGVKLMTWGRNLNIISVALFFVFAFTAFMKVWEILS